MLHQPGNTWDYSLSTDVLGRVVEVVSGKPLGTVLEERIYRPLKMTDTAFLVPAEKRGRFAQPLLNRGVLDGTRVLSRKTVEYMTSDHLGPTVSRGASYFAGPGYTWG